MFSEVELFREARVVGNSAQPHFIVIAVEEDISVLGSQPAVVFVIISLDDVGVATPIHSFKNVDWVATGCNRMDEPA